MVSRNQRVRVMSRGPSWSEDDKSVLFHSFFEIIPWYTNIDNPATQETMWPDHAAMVGELLGRPISENSVKIKIHNLQTRFNAFVTFTESRGVRLDQRSGRVIVLPQYWNRSNEETAIERQFRIYGFPKYEMCYQLFARQQMAKILIEQVGDNFEAGSAADNTIILRSDSKDDVEMEQSTDTEDVRLHTPGSWVAGGMGQRQNRGNYSGVSVVKYQPSYGASNFGE